MSQPQQSYGEQYSPGHAVYHPRNASPQVIPRASSSHDNAPVLSPLNTSQVSYARGPMSAVAATPSMAYNPQQWTQSQMGFQRVMPVASNTRAMTGMEAAMPSPPPPYTAAVVASPMSFDNAQTSTTSPIASIMSPANNTSPAFPPPPSSRRDRSAGGSSRIFNTIQSLTSRGKQPAVNEAGVQQGYEDMRPPASRRAASTGHMSHSSGSPSASIRQRQDSVSSLQNGMPLPGPPPGPPPAGSRSQSLNRFDGDRSSAAIAAPVPTRRTTLVASNLGPVPPTPADWIDSDTPAGNDYQPLRIDTGARQQSLSRRPATRDVSATGLRERRSRSKAAAREEPEDDDRAAMDSTTQGTISQRREHARKVSALAGQSSPMQHVMTPPYTPAVGRQDAIGGNDLVGAFFKHAHERHRQFLLKEAAARTDEERLEIFANYMVHESRVRRDRYHAAYNAMAGDIVDLTRDMWRSYSHLSSRRVATPNTANSRGPPSTTSDSFPRAESDDVHTPATDTSVDSESADNAIGRQRGESFKPCLSPIPSMAVSSVDDSSRGRAPSRWWEKSEGSGSIGKPERIEKSLRETKYMGVNPALLRASPSSSLTETRDSVTPGASTFALGPDEYPPEKVGWHEQEGDTPMPTPKYDSSRYSTARTPGQMDLSRLVTLPPPYPRHHPAVNNSHPSLSELRNKHRQLADNAEIRRVRDAHIEQHWALQRAQQDEAKKRRAKMRSSMQVKLSEGLITFADAAKTESKFDEDEAERSKVHARNLFDAFEASVSHPLNTLITEKLANADTCIAEMNSDLSSNNSLDPNRAQEEGDEHPERLEKLTLLRWLFDAREALHREMFELHAQRAEKYGEVVLTPYRTAKLQNKIDEAEAFFRKDGRQRSIVFHKERLQRCELFLTQIQGHVNSGVEDQVSAFWDIAPGLREVVQHIPVAVTADGEEHLRLLDRFEFMVPPQEMDENPTYRQFPLQYLYSVLGHTEKSTYQFIESQTNLWCLLHAVRELTAEANLKVIELEASPDTADEQTANEFEQEILHSKSMEQKRLTAELQEKVGEVERQWTEALGGQLASVKFGVKRWLEETGGWEEGLDG